MRFKYKCAFSLASFNNRCDGMKISIKPNSRIRTARDHANRILCWALFYPYILRHYLSSQRRFRKLHVGCGNNHFTGWINADIHPKSDLIIFLQKRLPFRRNSLDRIYSEHVLEHVPYPVGVFFLREAYRTLKLGGVLRLAMPDLDDLVDGYQTNWRRFDWVNWPQYDFIKTKAEMINIGFRWWGHQHLYNQEELERSLREAGFSKICFEKNGFSRHSDLVGLETRLDSKLIAEAVRE